MGTGAAVLGLRARGIRRGLLGLPMEKVPAGGRLVWAFSV